MACTAQSLGLKKSGVSQAAEACQLCVPGPCAGHRVDMLYGCKAGSRLYQVGRATVLPPIL